MKPKNPYLFFDKFCIRTPLLSLNFYFDLTKEKKVSNHLYKNAWSNDVIKEAIFLASPELFLELEKWFSGQTIDQKKIQRLQYSLLKYLSRMSSRCTPFGLFAGCTMGEFGKNTRIELESYAKNQRQTRFDMNFLVAFSQKLSKEEHIKDQLLWYPNNSLYIIGEQYRYIEYVYNKDNNRQHSIEAVARTPYLDSILEHAKIGKKVDDLALLLVDDDISIEEAKEYINVLIDNQILTSELEPAVTGKDFLNQIRETLDKLQSTEQVTNQIQYFQNFLDQIDKKVGNLVSEYEESTEEIKKSKVNINQKYLFQTDMYPRCTQNTLSSHFGYKIARAMSFFNKISSPYQNPNLQRFTRAFIERYETREVPLAKALDTEIGIGYLQDQNIADHRPFLNDLSIPKNSENITSDLPWSPLSEVLYQKLTKTLMDKEYILQLQDNDFEHVEIKWDLPDTVSTLAEIVSLDNQEKIVLSSIGGSSAGNLLGRFSTGNSEIMNHVRDIADIEQTINTDKLVSEIIHLPESRTGNVIRRATFRKYEIPYLGKSNLPEDHQILINDIMISIRNNRIFLRSKQHNKEILPRLTNAHNYAGQNSLPVYHFLCDLQSQNQRSSIGFNWGSLMKKNMFLPRVEYKEFILSKARWKITKENSRFLFEKEYDENEMLEKVKKWRAKFQIPKFVQLIDYDNTLLINLENTSSVGMLLNIIKTRQLFTLEEFLFTGESLAQSDEENYTNQFVFSFYNDHKLKRSQEQQQKVPNTIAQNIQDEKNVFIR